MLRSSTGYYVEKRELGGEWGRVNFYPCTGLTYVVPGLREGARYEFRIVACNEAGPGQPSRPSEPVTAGVQKFPPGPPEGVNPDRITKSTVTLSWRPPRNDGGCKITGKNYSKCSLILKIGFVFQVNLKNDHPAHNNTNVVQLAAGIK